MGWLAKAVKALDVLVPLGQRIAERVRERRQKPRAMARPTLAEQEIAKGRRRG